MSVAYNVGSIRSAGLEAKWGRLRSGAPALFARKPGTTTWWLVTASCYGQAQKLGWFEAFDCATILGEYFSVSV